MAQDLNRDSKTYSILSNYYSGGNVSVSVSGSDAYTDGKNIHLPDLGEGLTEYMTGFLAHENAHIKFSDFSALGTINDPVVHAMTNALEDVRIERKMCLDFPRVYKSLTATVAKALEIGGFAFQKNLPVEGVAIGYAISQMRTKLMGYAALNDIAQKYKQDFSKRFPAEFKAISGLISEYAPKMASTADAVSLAGAIRKIIKIVENQKKQKEPEPNKQNNARGDKKTNDEDIAEKINNMIQNNDPFGSQIRNKIAKKEGEKNTENLTEVFIEEGEPGAFSQIEVRERETDGDGGSLIRMCGNSSLRLRELLKNYVQAEDMGRDCEKGTKGRLMSRKLNRMAVNDARVFNKRHICEEVNTDIHLLCDISGSMNRRLNPDVIRSSKWAHAAEYASFYFADSLDRIEGLKRSVSYFSYGVMPIIGTRDAARKNAGRFMQKAYGSTESDEAIEYAGTQLSQSEAARKIIIMITDGCPNNAERLKQAIEKAKRAGIELIGIGIQCDCVKEFFDNWEVINVSNLNDIKNELMRIVKNLIKK